MWKIIIIIIQRNRKNLEKKEKKNLEKEKKTGKKKKGRVKV